MKLYNHDIDPNSTIPLRDQVKEILETEIRSGRWEVGDRLPTAREISKMTDISATTVTYALAALYQEGYLDRHVGRGSFLRTTKTKPKRRTGVIGIVLGGSWTPGQAVPQRLPFFHDLIELVDETLADWDYSTRIFHEHTLHVEDDEPGDVMITPSELSNVDGIVNIGAVPRALWDQVRSRHMPMICLATTDTPRGVPYVTVDDRHEMWEAVERLHAAGHRKIGMIHAIPDLNVRRLHSRHEAFVGACVELGIPPKDEWIIDVGPAHNLQLVKIKEFFGLNDRPTGVLTISDAVTKGVYDVASLLDKRIPEDLSLICTTASADFGAEFRAPASALVTDTVSIASVGADMLVDMIKTDNVAKMSGALIRSKWVPRGSHILGGSANSANLHAYAGANPASD